MTVEGPAPESSGGRVAHGGGRGAVLEPLVEHLAAGLGHRRLVGLVGGGQHSCVDAGSSQAIAEIGQVAQLGFDVLAPVQRSETPDQVSFERVEIASDVTYGHDCEPPVEVAPVGAGDGGPRLGTKDGRTARGPRHDRVHRVRARTGSRHARASHGPVGSSHTRVVSIASASSHRRCRHAHRARP